MTQEQFRELIERPIVDYAVKYDLHKLPKKIAERNQYQYLQGVVLDIEDHLLKAGILISRI